MGQSLNYRSTKWHKSVFFQNVSMEREGKEREKDDVRSGKKDPRKFVSLILTFSLVDIGPISARLA